MSIVRSPCVAWLAFSLFCPLALTAAEPPASPNGEDRLPPGAIVRLGSPGPAKARDSGAVYALAFSPDGTRLAAASGDRTIRLWDWRAAKEVSRFDCSVMHAEDLLFSPSGDCLVASCGDVGCTWELPGGRRTEWWPESHELGGVAFGPDGSIVAAEGKNLVWRDRDGLKARKRVGTGERLFPAVFAPRATLMAVPGQNGGVVVWNVGTGQPAQAVQRLGEVTALALSPDGRYLAFGSQSAAALILWDLTAKAECQRWRVPGLDEPRPIAFTADSRLLVVLEASAAVRVYEIASRASVLTCRGWSAQQSSFAVAPNGRVAATGGADGTVLLWDLTGQGKPATRQQLDALWNDLTEDAAQAYPAVWRLASASVQSVPFLRDRVKPATPVPADELAKLVADLDSYRFQERRTAAARLGEIGDVVEPALVKLKAEAQSAEVRRALSTILDNVAAERARPLGERLRAVRVVQALEYLGTPEAKAFLRELADGAPGATLTREAVAALGRLGTTAQ